MLVRDCASDSIEVFIASLWAEHRGQGGGEGPVRWEGTSQSPQGGRHATGIDRVQQALAGPIDTSFSRRPARSRQHCSGTVAAGIASRLGFARFGVNCPCVLVFVLLFSFLLLLRLLFFGVFFWIPKDRR
ncbi:hypothetical protein BCV70DRAFT_87748 [Testicularia cyperi]|uniref:Uncharacterized protein n=1 Tax=Testicularia cyperi TaxID=1882483 RepID=A0A317XSY1_9BASI|nr:hypothetical protein BCV70DRAFT_87748 [Testicularia cyperi]